MNRNRIAPEELKIAISANNIPLVYGQGWLNSKDNKIVDACALTHLLISRLGADEVLRQYRENSFGMCDLSAKELSLSRGYVDYFINAFDDPTGEDIVGSPDEAHIDALAIHLLCRPISRSVNAPEIGDESHED